MNILHQAETFILAELPLLENGVKHLVTIDKSTNTVMLHRVIQGAETVSSIMNLPIMREILQVANTLIP